MYKALVWLSIIVIALNGFSIQINNFRFEWIGLLEQIMKLFK